MLLLYMAFLLPALKYLLDDIPVVSVVRPFLFEKLDSYLVTPLSFLGLVTVIHFQLQPSHIFMFKNIEDIATYVRIFARKM
ncbi:MAG: hypothetical protein BWX47_00819 [candidate division Hyd24-12 bacterium ADurb.Bin004]|nr:MAG: hypothetical protein BWX47_00819 [candidate division Hyd24-12 bacterium ADurb.Bin004]